MSVHISEHTYKCGLDPWDEKMPCRRAWQPAPVFLPGESHGQRSLEGCRSWGAGILRVVHDWVHTHAFRGEDLKSYIFLTQGWNINNKTLLPIYESWLALSNRSWELLSNIHYAYQHPTNFTNENLFLILNTWYLVCSFRCLSEVKGAKVLYMASSWVIIF